MRGAKFRKLALVGVLGVASISGPLGGLLAQPATAAPAKSVEPTRIDLVLSDQAHVAQSLQIRASALLRGVIVANSVAVLEVSRNGAPLKPVKTKRTSASGLVEFAWKPREAGLHSIRVTVTPTAELEVPESATPLLSPVKDVSVQRGAAELLVKPSAPSVKSETAVALRSLLMVSGGLPFGNKLRIEYQAFGKPWRELKSGPASVASLLAIDHPWKTVRYRASYDGDQNFVSKATPVVTVRTSPSGRVVQRPKGRSEPAKVNRRPNRPAPVGSGAHPRIRRIPNAVFARMNGISWTQGCVPRSSLRYVTVNYWGFDGYRYRGEIVVHRSIAKNVAGIFSDFYRIKYPLRQMRLVDDFGRGPWIGANDYASMAADNTSGFNCRYVVGKEPNAMSPHASGHALDINTWENPYTSPRGVFPDRSYLNRRGNHPAMIHGGSKARKIMGRHGCSWLGSRDYQHFDCWGTATRSTADQWRDPKYAWGSE